MQSRKYHVPPVMTKSVMVGGFSLLHMFIIILMVVIIGTVMINNGELQAFFWFTVPAVYAVMVYRQSGESYTGADFFKSVCHYLWTPQVFVLFPSVRKEN